MHWRPCSKAPLHPVANSQQRELCVASLTVAVHAAIAAHISTLFTRALGPRIQHRPTNTSRQTHTLGAPELTAHLSVRSAVQCTLYMYRTSFFSLFLGMQRLGKRPPCYSPRPPPRSLKQQRVFLKQNEMLVLVLNFCLKTLSLQRFMVGVLLEIICHFRHTTFRHTLKPRSIRSILHYF